MAPRVRTWEVRCRCGRCDLYPPEKIVDYLRKRGKIRVGKTPDPDVMQEVFRTTVEQGPCPGCGGASLRASLSAEAEGEWQQVRVCAGCGKPIPPERLEASPGAVLCVRCQSREEQGLSAETPEFCPRCGAPLTVRVSRSSTGGPRYVMTCTAYPPCRL